MSVTTGVLVNVAGFLLGGVLYGLLLVMAVRASPTSLGPQPIRPGAGWLGRPLVWAGMLGLLWNVGAFLAYGFPAARTAPFVPGLTVASFVALGFLPAVVVQVVLGETFRARGWPERGVIAAAYAMSCVAAGLHLHAVIDTQPLPSRAALSLLTLGFLALLLPLVILTTRARQGRAVWVVALALFGVSAHHLIQHTGQETWWIEVLGHQGSLLLPVAILVRDYRFAFADLFLRRAVALSLTVALVLAVHVTLQRWNSGLGATDASLVAYVLALTVVAALVQGQVQRVATWLVDTVLLRRVNYEAVMAMLEADLANVSDEELLIERAQLRIGTALGARHIETATDAIDVDSSRPVVFVDEAVPASGGGHAVAPTRQGLSAVVTIPTVETPRHAWRLGRLAGERRLLSDDLRLLDSAASLVGRRIDAVRVARVRLEAAVRQQEMERLTTEAELRALRAQIDPHFLFNALTTIRYLVRASPSSAEATLLRLTSLLRVVLRRTRVELTTLGDEVDFVESYLEIERARFEERLHVTIDVPPALRPLRIPSLLIQPLVENAVKHGVAPYAAGGHVQVLARMVPSHAGTQLRISVHDSGSGSSHASWADGRQHGVGLTNVERRLRCHFGARATFDIDTGTDNGTIVALMLPVDAHTAPVSLLETTP